MYSIYEDIPLFAKIRFAKKVSFFLEEKQPSLPKVDLEINEDDLLKKINFGLGRKIEVRKLGPI